MDTKTRTEQPLSAGDALLLGELVDMCTRTAKVRWMNEEVSSEIRTGLVRHIVHGEDPSEWGFPNYKNRDIRDCFVRITTTDSGWDFALPVMKVIDLMRQTLFVEDK
jgi:hypothetical protein